MWSINKDTYTFTTAGGKVLVNDPNDSSSKNYINREFDMMTEVHATANAYWIFAKK